MTEWRNLLEKWQRQWDAAPDDWRLLLPEIDDCVRQAEATGELVPESVLAFREHIDSARAGEAGEPSLPVEPDLTTEGGRQPDEERLPTLSLDPPLVDWRALLEDWKAQLEAQPVQYADIWAEIQSAQDEAGGDLPQAVRDFWSDADAARLREFNGLRQAAQDIYNDPSLLPEQKIEPFDNALARRLYPDGVQDPGLVQMRASLSNSGDRRHVELVLAYVHHQLKIISEQLLPHQEQHKLLRECRTALEQATDAIREVVELSDLKGHIASTLSRVNEEIGHLAQYVEIREKTRALRKAWVTIIKENQAKINAGIAWEDREVDGEIKRVDLVEENEICEKEYAQDALLAAKEKFAAATGCDFSAWGEHGRPLNPLAQIKAVIKDLKVGLITLVPSTYQSKFPDTTVEGDRSIDPAPLSLDIKERDQFPLLEQTLNEALEASITIQQLHEKLDADGVTDEERLRSSYAILAQHPIKEIKVRVPRVEDAARAAINSQMKRIKGSEHRRIWRLDRNTGELERLRSSLQRHPLYIDSASEQHREFVRGCIGELSELKEQRAACIEQRIEFENQLNHLAELLGASNLDLAEAARVSDDLARQYGTLDGDSLDQEGAQNETARLILGAGLREKYQETDARFKAITREDDLYAELQRYYEQKHWEKAERLGKAAYGDDATPRDDSRWLSGRSMYLLALAHSLCARAETLPDEDPARKSYVRGAQVAFEELQQVAPDRGEEIAARIETLREVIENYERENEDARNVERQLDSLIGDHLPFYRRNYLDASEEIAKIPEANLREQVHRRFVNGWRTAVELAIGRVLDDPGAMDEAVYTRIRAGLKALGELGKWNNHELETDYHLSLLTVFRQWQTDSERSNKGRFGLALSFDQYEDWYRTLERYFEHDLTLGNELSEVAAYLQIAQAEKNEGVKQQVYDIELALDSRQEHDRHVENARHLLIDALLYCLDRQIVDEYQRAGNTAQNELSALVEQMQTNYKRLIVLPEAADLASIWEHRVTSWRALLDGQISRALSRLTELEELSGITNAPELKPPTWLKRRCLEITTDFVPDQKTRIRLFITDVLNDFVREEKTPGAEQLVKILEYALILSEDESGAGGHITQRTILRLKPEMAEIATHLESDLGYTVKHTLPDDLHSARSQAESLHAQLSAIVAGLKATNIRRLLDAPGVFERYENTATQAAKVNQALTDGVKKYDEAIEYLTALITARAAARSVHGAWDFSRIDNALAAAQEACAKAFDGSDQDNGQEVRVLTGLNALVSSIKRSLLEDNHQPGEKALLPLKVLIGEVRSVLTSGEDPLECYRDALLSLEAIEQKHHLIQGELNSHDYLFSEGVPEFRFPDGFLQTRFVLPVVLGDRPIQEITGLADHKQIVRALRDRAVTWDNWISELNGLYEAVEKSQKSIGEWQSYLDELRVVIAEAGELPVKFDFLDAGYFDRIRNYLDRISNPNYRRNRPPHSVPYEDLSKLLTRCCEQVELQNKHAGNPPEDRVPRDLFVFFSDPNRLPGTLVNEIGDLVDVNEVLECLQALTGKLETECKEMVADTRSIKDRFDQYIQVLTDEKDRMNRVLSHQPSILSRIFQRGSRLTDQQVDEVQRRVQLYSRVIELLQGQL